MWRKSVTAVVATLPKLPLTRFFIKTLIGYFVDWRVSLNKKPVDVSKTMTEEPFFAQMSLLLKSASIPCAIMTLRLNSIDASKDCLELKLKKGDKKVHPILMSWATWHCPLYYVFVGAVPQPCGHLRRSTCGCWWASCWLNWSVHIIPHRLMPFTFLKFQIKV